MAGRGRGRRAMSFNVDPLAVNRGEGLPPSIQQPTPVFPAMEHKPLPLTGGEEAEYLLALKQEFRGAMKSLPFFIQPARPKRDVERYSDKYHLSEQTDNLMDWNQDWKRFPREVRVLVRNPPRKGVSLAVSVSAESGQEKKKKKKKEVVKEKEVLLRLETLEKKEEQASSEEDEGEEKKKKEEEEEVEEEEEFDEDEFEEETDYIMSYFDNGEEFGGDSDDNMDEAVY